jgi:FkbM family methyltransferase
LSIQQLDGWYWPTTDIHAREVILRDCLPSIETLLKHVPGRDQIVQAGANVGVYPIALTDRFNNVITAEPDPHNFSCLVKNLAARDSLRRVKALDAAFGAETGVCAPLQVEPHNCGAQRVKFGVGEVTVLTIDDLALEALDCIWLDVEGAELPALKGAARSIERFWPVITVEDKGLHRAFEIPDGALQAWLAERGYEQVDKIGQDKVFKRRLT